MSSLEFLLAIVANLATMYVHGYLKSALLWFKEYGIIAIAGLFFFGLILSLGTSIGINDFGLPKSWSFLTRIGFVATGLSMITFSFINEFDETWSEMSIFTKLYLSWSIYGWLHVPKSLWSWLDWQVARMELAECGAFRC
jgi:hypothetical protein